MKQIQLKRKLSFIIAMVMILSILGTTIGVFAETDVENKEAPKPEQASDTFMGNGGAYSLNYILNHYNFFVKNSAKTQHVVGPMVAGGSLDGNQSSYGGLSVKDPVFGWMYAHPAHTYIKGNTGKLNQLITNSSSKNLYVGDANKGRQYTVVTKTGANGAPEDWNQDQAYTTDTYVDFDTAFSALQNQTAALASGHQLTLQDLKEGTVEQHGYSLKNGTLSLQMGRSFNLESLHGVGSINFIGNRQEQQNTTIAVDSASHIQIGKTLLNGGEWPRNEVVTKSASILYAFPNTTAVSGNSIIGHIAAPKAAVTLTGGDYNGSVIADSLNTSAAEMHMWPYNDTPQTVVPAELTIKAEKTVDGQVPSDNQKFDFILEQYSDGSWSQIDLAQNEKDQISFKPLSFGQTHIGQSYWYRISEEKNYNNGFRPDAATYFVNVTVSAETSGQTTAIQADATYYSHFQGNAPLPEPVVFRNTSFAYEPVKAGFQFDKKLNGRDPVGEEFLFQAKVISQPDGTNATALHTKNLGPEIRFETELTRPGTYLYQVTEQEAEGYAIDPVKYYVQIETTSDPDGQLSIKNTAYYHESSFDAHNNQIKDDALPVMNPAFHNKSAKTSLAITGNKTLWGQKLESGQFTFYLTEVQENGSPVDQGITLAAVNKQGQFTFDTIEYTKPGTYYYQITEKNGGQTVDGITHDDSIIPVTVTVTETEDGLKASSDKTEEQIHFHNEYKENKADVTLKGLKTLEGKNLFDQQFTFFLYEADKDGTITGTAPMKTAKNDQSGNFSFDKLTFLNPGTYYYAITEQNGGETIAGITYDDAQIPVKVTVTKNSQGDLTASVSYGSGNQAKFTNKYAEVQQGSLTVGKRITTNGEPEPNTIKDSFYVALFNNDSRVSEVGEIQYDGEKEASTVTFTGLPLHGTYTVWETDRDGNRLEPGSVFQTETASYTVTGSGIPATVTGTSAVYVTNDIAVQYYYDASLKIAKETFRGDDPFSVTETYYAGVFTDQNFTAPLTLDLNQDGTEENVVVPLMLKDASRSEVIIEGIPVDPVSKTATLYVAETDRYGTPIAGNPAIHFQVHVENGGAVTVSPQETAEITITNTYMEGFYYDGGIEITKKVMYGKEDYNVVNTYYAGIFTDENYDTLLQIPDEYGNDTDAVIPLALNDESEVTISLSEIPLGVYYIAETDDQGIPLESGSDGFQISVKGAKAQVTQNSTPKTMITNTYDKKGTAAGADAKNDSHNGKGGNAQTGDASPAPLVVLILLAAGVVLIVAAKKRS